MKKKSIKPKKSPKRYHLNLSLMSIVFWGSGLLFLLAWIFVLGILVGRGSLPDSIKNLTELKDQIANLHNMVSTNESSGLSVIKNLDKDPKYAFFDELSSKKENPDKKKHTIVKKTQKKPDKEAKKKNKPLQSSATYTVQLSSLNNEIKALKMVNRLVDQGYPAYYKKSHIKGKTYFRVRCGPFKTKKEADVFKLKLAKYEKIKGFITNVEK